MGNSSELSGRTILLIKKIRIPNLNRAVCAMNIHIRVDAEVISDNRPDICRESFTLSSTLVSDPFTHRSRIL